MNLDPILRQLRRVLVRVDEAEVGRLRARLAKVEALAAYLRGDAPAARSGEASGNGRGGPCVPGAAALLEEKIATRLGMHQPASAGAIAGDLGMPLETVAAALASGADRFERLPNRTWRLKTSGEGAE